MNVQRASTLVTEGQMLMQEVSKFSQYTRQEVGCDIFAPVSNLRHSTDVFKFFILSELKLK